MNFRQSLSHICLQEDAQKKVGGLSPVAPDIITVKTMLNGWSGGAWLQLVRCALYLSTCP
jgi:hypothetical protein